MTMMRTLEACGYTLPAKALYMDRTVICKRTKVLHSSRNLLNECLLEHPKVKKEFAGFLFGIARLPTRIHKAIRASLTDRQSDSSRPARIDKAIRVGRPESTKRFESADPNRPADSSRPT